MYCLTLLDTSNSLQGYDTYIGERGASLSGGQKQRIVIARSIISNPKVLLLDEATSALDPNAEKIVQKALNNVAKGRTMIVIAHRLSTIRDADNIIVMSKGQILEQGTHSELIDANGKYANLVRAQDLGDREKSSESDEEDEKVAAKLDTVTSNVSGGETITVTAGDEISFGLLRCMFIVLREQKVLWWNLAVTSLCCIAGGR